jgi:death-on-curing protein
MAGNHGFVDANKRTTVILLDMLISNSGYRLEAVGSSEDLNQAVEDLVVGVVNRQITFDELSRWFAERLVRDRQ